MSTSRTTLRRERPGPGRQRTQAAPLGLARDLGEQRAISEHPAALQIGGAREQEVAAAIGALGEAGEIPRRGLHVVGFLARAAGARVERGEDDLVVEAE